jgi:hypothetical protein
MIRQLASLLMVVAAVPIGASAVDDAELVAGDALLTLSGNTTHRWRFTARAGPAGISGELELLAGPAGGPRLLGAIACARADGATGTARLAARVERSTVPLAPVGGFLVWTVVDNGEGARAAADLASELVPIVDPAVARGHCSAGLLPLTVVEGGSIQVRR